jgi:hypothetical protein
MNLLPVLTALLLACLTGCSAVSKTLGTATNAVGTGVRALTGPLRGMSNATSPGPEAGWQEGIRRVQQEAAAQP